MKELSIEEKAKRYESALERCRKLYNEAKANGYATDMEDYETIFQELAEPEDERIRKALLKMVYDINNRLIWVDYGIHKEDALNWLEKQGNQDNAEDVEEPDFFDDFRKSDVEVDSNEDGLIAETIRYKKEKQGEQKTAWSEEDEKFLNVAINILNSSKVYTKSPDKYEDTINWLKSFKERFQLQNRHKYKRIKPITMV